MTAFDLVCTVRSLALATEVTSGAATPDIGPISNFSGVSEVTPTLSKRCQPAAGGGLIRALVWPGRGAVFAVHALIRSSYRLELVHVAS